MALRLLSRLRLPGSSGPAVMLSIRKPGHGDVRAAFRGARCPGLVSGEEGVGVLLPPPPP